MSDRDALRDELDFLLASIDDLERERSAGDVDADDHRRLLDGYTARAARISRLLDGPEVEVTSPETPSAGPRRRPTTGVLGILAVIAVAALASWFDEGSFARHCFASLPDLDIVAADLHELLGPSGWRRVLSGLARP